ncbi:MAG: rhodanese-like domain-containing protein [Alphaproteobacteria bacterium]|nr:rhodanese-like domain-containing protein [Alphaproteobacteria bacterium]
MSLSLKEMMEAANAAVPRVAPAQANAVIARGNTLLLDVREAPEVENNGKIAGALRGMLEFRVDPQSPLYDRNFARDRTVILYFVSGGRAAIAGKLLKEMGFAEDDNMGGFTDWVDGGGTVERVIERGM